MKIVIAGATGFLGRPLTERLVSEGHDVVILTRRAAPRISARALVWSPGNEVDNAWAREIDGADATEERVLSAALGLAHSTGAGRAS